MCNLILIKSHSPDHQISMSNQLTSSLPPSGFSLELFVTVNEFLKEPANQSTLEVRGGVSGVLFKGVDEPPEGDWIALSNLGYNSELGFFNRTEFPNATTI